MATSLSSLSSLSSPVVADDGEEDVLQGRLLLDVLDLGGREEPFQLGEGAVRDDASLVEDRDPVGELFGLVQILGREQHRRALPGELLDRVPHLDARLGSSPVVGSSRKITGGFPMRLMAMSRRRRMPPEYVDTLRSAASVSWKRASRSSAIWPASSRCRNRATSTRFSRPVRISSTAANCPVRLMDSRTFAGCVATSKPSTRGRPRVGLEQRGQDLHDRGLARAVGAEQREDAAPCHVEVHAAQHVQLLVRLLEAPHVDRLNRLRRHREVPSSPVSSPAARSMALVSRSRSRLIH